jgi:hypothetical protein
MTGADFSLLFNEESMMLSRNMIVALTMAGSAAIAAAVAIQRHARKLERTQHKMDLQRWENETGSTLPRVAENPLS